MDPVRSGELLGGYKHDHRDEPHKTQQHEHGKEPQKDVRGVLEALHVPVDVPARRVGVVPTQDGTVEEGHRGMEQRGVEQQDQ